MDPSPERKRRSCAGMNGLCSLALAVLLLIAVSQPALAARDVRVGLHELRPSLYTDDQGKPAGIFVDLLTDIASREGWNIVWVHGTLSDNLDRLEKGEIDLISAITDTPERERVYDFAHESAVSTWAQVYAPDNKNINSILDLDGKRIALLRGDINNAATREYAEKFGIVPVFIEYNTLSEVFSATVSGEADAAVASRVAGQYSSQQFRLPATTVMFYPNALTFAVPKGRNADLTGAIDRYLAQGKADPSSFYSQTMQKWFGEKAGWVIHPYVLGGLVMAVIVIVLFVIMSLLLRREVKRKTAEVSRRNEALLAEVASRKRAESELVRKNEELLAAYKQLAATEEELRGNYRELGKTERVLRQARRKLNLLNTLTFQEIQNSVFSLGGYLELAKDAGSGGPVKDYIAKGSAILRGIQGSLRFAKTYQDMGMNEPKWQNVSFVLLNALSHLDLSTIERTISLEGLQIYADPLLEKVFYNIMENLLMHAKTATTVSVRFEEREKGIAILIEDNGPGIPADDKERIFERGFSGHASDLFLAREILSITGITIAETGLAGAGARFEIFVPDGMYHFLRKDGENPKR
ncbi:MAG TPA: transporter substrate-binding domain-containing protein [Methanoregulaceae archaeon]|nr:transporter substrate-binding domain-containing protein [Methanoregulaceae archaeon]